MGNPGVSTSQPNRSIHEIEGLRAILAFWVFLYHTLYWCNLHVPVLYDGGLAVQAFMLISGFVITRMLLRSMQPYGVFIFRRFARLYPAFLISLIFGLAVSQLTSDTYSSLPWQVDDGIRLGNTHLGRHAVEQAHMIPLLLGHLTLLHGVFPEQMLPDSSLAFVPPAWSLSLEWQFYLLAPFLVLAFRIDRFRLAITVASILAIVLGHFLGHHFTYIVPSFLPLSIVYFIVGIMCGHMYDRLALVPEQFLFYGVSFLTILLFAILGTQCLAYVSWLWTLGSSLKSQNTWFVRLSRALGGRALTFLGDRSYSFYLFHEAILACCAAALLRFGVSSKIEMLVLLLATALPLTLTLSVASYRFVELPAMKWARSYSAGRP
jgi:peptidoglycan/LPS O-acetylase OafA/YrhL